ncbi:MAG: DUF2461 domain-containing protein [Actinobacteria bacterium]|nr:DUF2461 domain-containing protein [Actinomycetota bacterium]
MADSTFSGYSVDAWSLLAELPTYDKERFSSIKKDWIRLVLDPTKALVDAMIDPLRSAVSPTISGAPKVNGSISPINNDLRFSPDKDPYKDHLLIAFWDGASKKASPVTHVRLSAEGVGLASGSTFQPDLLDRWRQLVDNDATGESLTNALAPLIKLGADVVGEGLQRVPKPYSPDHRRGDLLKHKWLQVRWMVDRPAEATTTEFPEWLADQLAVTAPLNTWLRDDLHA